MKKHTEDFKREAVRIALSSGLSRRRVASDLGVGLSTLGKWVCEYRPADLVAAPQADLARENERLIAFDDTGVTFRYKDYRRDGPERQRVMTISADEFIRRFLLHALPRGFHRIRHYGLLASSARKANLVLARTLLAVAPEPSNDNADEPIDHRPPCPCCGGHMVIIETFERWQQPRAPPSMVIAARKSKP